MTIAFNTIPINIRTPGNFIEYDNTRAVQGLSPVPNVVVMLGQRLAAGTVAAETPVLIASKTVGETFFGHGSMLAQMIEKFKAANAHTELWAIALDDVGAGVVATGTFPFVGTATEDGNVYLYIGGERITAAVSTGDTAAVVAAAIDAAITDHLLTSNMPVSPSVLVGTVTVTALHKGLLGNDINLALNLNPGEALPAGITCTPVAMASGATDPDVADAIAVFSDVWYTTIVSPYNDDTNQDKIEAELLTRWGPMVMQDGLSFIAARGTSGALTTLGNARNSQFTNFMGAGLSPTPSWLWAAVVAAIDTAEPDPARPRQTLALPGLVAPAAADQFDQPERNILLTDGISTFTIAQDGTVNIERLITTYQTNPTGIPDVSYLDVTTMRTLAALRYTVNVRMALKFPRHKLANDGTNFGPGQKIVTPLLIRTELLSLFLQWEADGLVEGFEQYKSELKVERSSSDANRANALMPPDLMNQFRVFAGQIQFLL